MLYDPVAVVQHTVPGFAASLARWLDDSAQVRVRLAVNGGRVEGGDVVIAPDGAHLHIDADGCTRLLAQSPVDGHRPSGSVLLSSIARSYGAACTPDFFGFNSRHKLQYRGRLDASTSTAGPADLRRDLFEAMKQVAETGHGPKDQIASMGCSIKWKDT